MEGNRDQDEDPNSKRVKLDGASIDRAANNRTPTVDEVLAALTGGWTPERVKVNEWQLYPSRLAEVLLLEQEGTPLNAELAEEKTTILAQGFPKWDRNDFRVFLKACIDKGKDEVQEIAMELPEKTLEEVTRYAHAFWERGPTCFTAENWTYIQDVVNQGRRNKEEAALDAIRQLVYEKLGKGPRPKLLLHKSVRALLGHDYCEDEDAFMLNCLVEKKSVENVIEAVKSSPLFSFDHFFRGHTVEDIEKRVQVLIEVVKKDQEESVMAEMKAQKERDAREQEELALVKREQELMAKIEELERLIHAPNSNPPEILQTVIASAANASLQENNESSEYQPGGEDGENASDSGGVLSDPTHYEVMLKVVAMSGSCGLAQLVEKISKALPDLAIAKRQLKREVESLVVKEKRAGDRVARWYPKAEIVSAKEEPA